MDNVLVRGHCEC